VIAVASPDFDEDMLWRVLKRVGEDLAVGTVAEVALLIRVGEPLVAYETMVAQLYEYAVTLEPSTASDLHALGAALQADAKFAAWIVECLAQTE
jgi:hypothetical protein